MFKRDVFIALACLTVAAFSIGCSSDDSSTSSGDSSGATVSASDVMNLISANCMPCHASGDPSDGLAMDTLAGLMKGGDHGPVVNAGDSAGSTIIKSLRGDGVEQMPYMQDPLSDADIQLIADWIDAGAPQS